ncbi:hypothetical protein PGTUg99_010595 [Puccinia graminis f. sp. tritici]|uniref:FAR1 domain-containing protein n=1 Tax=Puccinia graminis f. sp. tritici TaxID=56615 RepID=A0A5B0MHG8_PUCGR|nr:hypothetical protein PGTUg99_010595 [Puccinia graminis f. sp. tritici]
MASTSISSCTFVAYPPVQDIYDVVPRPMTEEIPVPEGVTSAPNALRFVRHVGGSSPTFPTHPHLFTIPGNTLEEAQEFVNAMLATTRWNFQRGTPPSEKDLAQTKGRGRRPEAFFKLEYRCSSGGQSKRVSNSRKKNHTSARCGCKARFSISHHIQTNSLRVAWHWQHNHELTSHQQMLITRPPLVVDNWVKDRVDAGLGWKEIYDLTQTNDVLDLQSSTVKPEASGVTYDRVRYLIRTRRTANSQPDI